MYYVYRITNKINGKTYIGQHKYKMLNDSYMGSGKLIKRAQKKYGMENFEKEILYGRIQYKATADDMERFAIAKEKALGKAEYNIADGGNGGNLGEEVNKKISEAQKGRHPSEETIRKRSEAMKGHKVSEETRKKISEANKGRVFSDEWRRKMSENHKGMEGKKHSEETRRKLSESLKGKNKGKHRTDEQKRRMSEAMKGKASDWLKGKHRSEETKRKISEYRKGKPSPTKGKRWKLVDGKHVYY